MQPEFRYKSICVSEFLEMRSLTELQKKSVFVLVGTATISTFTLQPRQCNHVHMCAPWRNMFNRVLFLLNGMNCAFCSVCPIWTWHVISKTWIFLQKCILRHWLNLCNADKYMCALGTNACFCAVYTCIQLPQDTEVSARVGGHKRLYHPWIKSGAWN